MQVKLNISEKRLKLFTGLIYNRFSHLDLSLPKNHDIDLSEPVKAEILTNKGKLVQEVRLTIGNYAGHLSVHTQIENKKTKAITDFYEIITPASPNVQSPRASSEVRETIIRTIHDAIGKSILFGTSPKVSWRINDDTDFIVGNSPIPVLTEPHDSLDGAEMILRMPIEEAAGRIEKAMSTGQNIFPEVKGDHEDHRLLIGPAEVSIYRLSA